MSHELPKIENTAEKKIETMTPEEKIRTVQLWNEVVLASPKDIENVENMSKEDLREWMCMSISEDIKKLCQEWNIISDEKLINKIKSEPDTKRKAELELKYIRKMHDIVDAKVQRDNKRRRDVSTRWDSWPKKMKESGMFNCVGATLVGLEILEKAGIENYWGNPVGHVINIVKLSNGKWWYVDFLNGKLNVFEIEPEETVIGGTRVFNINNKDIEYRLIPVLDKREATRSILGNLCSAKEESEDRGIPDEDRGKIEAKLLAKILDDKFKELNIKDTIIKLRGHKFTVDDTKEMEGERERVNRIRGFYEGEPKKYLESLIPAKREVLKKDVRKNMEGIRDFFYNDDEKILDVVIPEVKNVLILYREALKKIKETDREEYEEMVRGLLRGA